MFESMIDNSGITAFKTIEAMRKMIPKWACLKCGELHTEERIECGHCSHKRPDPHGIIANRMLMDLEEKFDEYMNGGFGSGIKTHIEPKIFHRYLLTIAKHCEKYNIDMDMIREPTRKAIESLPKDEKGNVDVKAMHKEELL